jgi:D-alanine-D-alanine ligase
VNEASRRVAVVFGGTSVEHDVSIITAQQVMAVLGERHEVVPIYIAIDGRWWTGPALLDIQSFASQPPAGARPLELRLGSRTPFVEPSTSRLRREQEVPVDVVINAIHGTSGEDGTLLGALELAGIPYAGRGVTAAAVSMDKHLAKVVVADAGVDVLEHLRIERFEWEQSPADVLARVRDRFDGDVVVKPVTLGSSVGVQRCAPGGGELEDALELAFELDRQAMVEPFAAGAVELNVAVLGRPGEELVVSEVERPIGGEGGLSFEDKYLRRGGAKGKGGGAPKGANSAVGVAVGGGGAKGGGESAGMAAADRVIPADVDPAWREAVKTRAVAAHRALRLAGVVRYDFFVLDDGARFVLNEPNTVPGSFAFYLFDAIGLGFDTLVERLIEIALAESREERSTTRAFESALLSLHVGRT